LMEKGGEIPEPVAKLDEEQTAQQEVARRNWAKNIRRDIVWGLGIIATVLRGAVRPEVNRPYDFWAASVGGDCLWAALCLYLYDVLEIARRGRTLLVVWFAGVAVSTVLANDAMHAYTTAQLAAASDASPRSTPTTGQAFEPLRFTPDISQWVLSVGGGASSYAPNNCPDLMIPYPLNCGGDAVVMGYCQNNTFGVNVNLFADAKDGPHAYLRYGQFSVDVPGWDFNWDHNALEVVDRDYTPRMQVLYKADNYIEVFGTFGDGPDAVRCGADRRAYIPYRMAGRPPCRGFSNTRPTRIRIFAT
jgi:hypothetical protein